MKNIILLGSTGSIGTQTLDIVKKNPTKYNLVGVSLGRDLNKSIELIKEYNPSSVIVRYNNQIEVIKKSFPHIIICEENQFEKFIEINKHYDNCLLVNALMGSIGLLPTVKAIENKIDVAIANKETLVIAGEIINKLLNENNVKLFPIDSEHSAILQCLIGEKKENIKEIIITASGGSFRDYSRDELEHVTVEDALKHPNWKMGNKITIDSATMMNKGLEVIEAHYLFDVDYDQIKTIIHRESIIHSMVKFKDNSVKAQLGLSDMRIPINYALGYPDRLDFEESDIDFVKIGKLSFNEMDFNRYPLLKLAYECGKMKGNMPCIMNACNEACVQLFLDGKIGFLDIEKIVIEEVYKEEYRKDIDINYLIDLDLKIKNQIIKKYGGE